MKFWHNHSVSEIARHMRIDWSEANRLLTKGQLKLRAECVRQPRFAKTLPFPALTKKRKLKLFDVLRVIKIKRNG